jgi:hypothetical protein
MFLKYYCRARHDHHHGSGEGKVLEQAEDHAVMAGLGKSEDAEP